MAKYDLELDAAVAAIKKEKAKLVAVQLPSGLKPETTQIIDYLHEKTGAVVVVWMDGAFGACDVPDLPVDLLIQWGHSPWVNKVGVHE